MENKIIKIASELFATELKNKTNITANFASKQALAKIKKAGGSIIILKKYVKTKSQVKTNKDNASLEILKK